MNLIFGSDGDTEAEDLINDSNTLAYVSVELHLQTWR